MSSTQDWLFGADDIAALLSSPPATPAFVWTQCTYTLRDSEGGIWQMASPYAPRPSVTVTMERLPNATATGWAWHKNHQLPPLNVACGGSLPEGSACLMSAVTVDVMTHGAYIVGCAAHAAYFSSAITSRPAVPHPV